MTRPQSALANNYSPLPVEIASASGAWVTDTDGKRYLDLLAAYSAVNFGHRHPQLIAAAKAQLDRVTLVSRAFENDQLEPFAAELARLAGKQLVLPMNTGAEAVESGIKVARAWGYRVKGVQHDRATARDVRGPAAEPLHAALRTEGQAVAPGRHGPAGLEPGPVRIGDERAGDEVRVAAAGLEADLDG